MNELIFKIIFMVLYVIAAAGRAPYAQKVKKIKTVVSVKKTREYFLITLGSVMMIIPLIYIFSNWIGNFNMNLPITVRIIGGIGFAFAVFLHNWSHVALKTNWSPVLEIKEKQKLITNGPYKYVRHPMYTAFFLWMIFQGLFLSNWVVLIVGIASFAILYFVRIGDEEEMMTKQFGKEYKDYMKKTGRLFPKLG